MRIIFLFFFIYINSIKSQTDVPFDYQRIWGTYLGGGYTYIEDSALDFNGNLWLVGYTNNPIIFNQYITSNAHQSIFSGNYDGIIVKLSPQGNILYASYYGGSNFDNIKSITIDFNNNIYIGGNTSSFNNIATSESFQNNYNNNITTNSSAEPDGFLVKFNNNGIRQWGTYYGGNRDNSISKIITDNTGSIYIYGSTKSNNLATPNAFKYTIPDPTYLLTLPDGTNIYFYGQYPLLSKFDTTGNRVWATYYGPDISNSTSNEFSITNESLSIDTFGNIYVSGRSGDNLGYYATADAHQSEVSGSTDIYISKFSPSGIRLWGTYFGGESSERVPKIVIDSNNNLYLVGRTKSTTNIATQGTFKSTYSSLNQFEEYFIAKFNSLGTRIWGTYFNQNISNLGGMCDIAIDHNDNIYIYGKTISQTNISTPLSYQETYGGGNTDAFFAKFNNSGNRLWASYYGGNNIEETSRIHLTLNNEFYLTGYTNSTTNIASPNALQTTHFGQDNETVIYLAKFIPSEPLSIISYNSIKTFTIYPNPSKSDFTIAHNLNFENIIIEIYDSLGRRAYYKKLNSFSNSQIISTNYLSPSVYIIKIKNENNQVLHTEKLVIQ